MVMRRLRMFLAAVFSIFALHDSGRIALAAFFPQF
jgi:hypothetical protein